MKRLRRMGAETNQRKDGGAKYEEQQRKNKHEMLFKEMSQGSNAGGRGKKK